MAETHAVADVRQSLTPRIGCDLAEVAEVADSIARFGDRYLRRIYSDAERRQAAESPERLAARFAGKEAVLKVLRDSSQLRFNEIEILNGSDGAPTVGLSPRAQRVAREQRLGPIAVSLSHERGMAMATAIAITEDAPRN